MERYQREGAKECN